jgi:hypothetical protein
MGEPPFCGTDSLLQIFQQESKLAACVNQTGLNYRARNAAQTRASRQKKANPEGLVFEGLVGWGHLNDGLKPA